MARTLAKAGDSGLDFRMLFSSRLRENCGTGGFTSQRVQNVALAFGVIH